MMVFMKYATLPSPDVPGRQAVAGGGGGVVRWVISPVESLNN